MVDALVRLRRLADKVPGSPLPTRRVAEAVSRACRELALASERLDATVSAVPADVVRNAGLRFLESAGHPRLLARYFGRNRDLRRLALAIGRPDVADPPIVLRPVVGEAVRLFESRWSDGLLVGLGQCVLSHWDTMIATKRSPQAELLSLVLERAARYPGSRGIIRAFRDNRQYFADPDGPATLGASVAASGRDFSASLESAGFMDSYQKYPLFDHVLVGYVESRRPFTPEFIESLTPLLSGRHDSDSVRVAVAAIVVAATSVGAECRQAIQRLALTAVGDPQAAGKWALAGKRFLSRRSQLTEARNIVNGWINGEVLSVFFERLSVYRERKDFWRSYVSRMPALKIAGSLEVRYRLQRDPRLRDALPERFIEARSGVPALLFDTGKLFLVEFAEHGNAFYSYEKTHRNWGYFQSRTIGNTSLLKDTSLPEIRAFEKQGRFVHRDQAASEWQARLARWLRGAAGIKL